MSDVEVIENFFAALHAKDVDKAIGYFAEDAVVESPMGPQKGKEQILKGLKMMSSMPAPKDPIVPEQVDGAVIAKTKSPMGTFTMTFLLSDGLITKQSVKMGG
jgi:ketosteroid isomerase-like protein